MRLLQGARGRVAAALAAAAVAGGVAAVGISQGNNASEVHLLSGAAWLASAKVGQITLLDGSSAEVSGQVRVANPGDVLTVVQQGATAYAVNQTTGSIRRVDGATFAATNAATPIADVHGTGLTVVASPTTLYALDTTRGMLASADPKTLEQQGKPVSVASRLAAGTVTVDDAGTLWAVDTARGDISRVMGDDKTVLPGDVKPGNSVITLANGHPVVVDPTDSKAVSINRDNGRVTGTADLDLRPDDRFQVSGSPHSERIYVVASRGVLDVCDLAASRCGNAIPLTVGGEFGPAVEAGDRVFVPDYTTGQVWIINLRDSRVVARANVLHPNVRFQLLSRDGVVFYNDTNSEDAGVVRLDGSVTTVKKYDRDNPAKGVDEPTNGPSSGAQVSSAASQPNQVPSQGQQQPVDSHVPNNNSSAPDNSSSPESNSVPNDPQPQELNLRIVVDKQTPTVDEIVNLTVTDASGATPRGAHWTYGDGAENDGVTTNHKWARARPEPYIVSVEATMPDGRRGTRTVNVTVSEVPTFRLAVTPPTGGKVSGGGIDCPGTCSVDLAKDVQVTLTAIPDANHLPGTWGGACHSTDTRCDVKMGTQPLTVSYAFNPKPDPPLRLTATRPANGSISGGGLNCPNTCTADIAKGTPVTLTAHPSAGYLFDSWGGDCSGTTCSLTMNAAHSVSATFVHAPFKVDVVNQYTNLASHHAWVDVSDGHNCTSGCHYTVPFNASGGTLTFKIGLGVAAHFHGWLGDCASAGVQHSCTVTVNHDIAVGAMFASS
jgi:hypothetical protein